MSDSATITREQLRTVVIATELGGRTGDSNHFAYAGLGNSTYSFGQLQFDVGHGSPEVEEFLKANGFDATDIAHLSKHGGLSRDQLNALDTKLQAIPQAKLDEFTNSQLDKKIGWVGEAIDDVRKINPAAADAIGQDQKLQLGIADYRNQFGHGGPQLAQFLAGEPTTLAGGQIQAGSPPTREDIQIFIANGRFGQDPANARGIAGREERFNEAMAQLNLGPSVASQSHAAGEAGDLLRQGMHSDAVRHAQEELHDLGYLQANPNGRFGPQTKAATESFQRDQGIGVDGTIGTITQRHLNDAVNANDQRQAWDAVKNAPLLLNDPAHPDNTMYRQAQQGVYGVDAQLGRIPDVRSDQVAAALTVAHKQKGLSSIDNVLLGENGEYIFANQGPLGSGQVSFVNTQQAVNTTIQQSSVQWQAVDQAQTQAAQQAQAQTQNQVQVPQPQGPVL